MASSSKPAENKFWGGRFTGILLSITLFLNDILGSIAFARTNYNNGILTQHKFEEIETGLLEDDEDIHTANERQLGEIIGQDIAGKLHTERSRNKQVVCDMRMWPRDEPIKLEGHLVSFLNVTATRAEKEIDYIMPGCSHLQRAQPVRWSHWMLSYAMAFANDLERLREVIKRYSSSQFGFVRLADVYSAGSSSMPHKVLRGKGGRVFGQMAGFMMTQNGLPSTYNKDLQESWEPMLDHAKTVSDSVQIAEGVLAAFDTHPEKMKAALDPFTLATDVADYLVRKGAPFRETHHVSDRCVTLSEKTGIPAIDERFEEVIADIFNYEKSVEMRAAKGGTSKSSVFEQIAVLRASLE
ncbi:L-Aspartase-like protein [Colletotrichum eremochloae]|nr:L-Aspartase-like protein [Colletotrichum eremochloae]